MFLVFTVNNMNKRNFNFHHVARIIILKQSPRQPSRETIFLGGKKKTHNYTKVALDSIYVIPWLELPDSGDQTVETVARVQNW